jgi:peroxiredoxin Q/BCP
VLYFYPKDNTPGCTLESNEFNELLPQFKKENVQILGVSRDSLKSHDKFICKFDLKFPLLSDETKSVCEAYGVWGLKKFMGREFLGIHRVSFLIDPKGKIAKVYDPVKASEHASEVLSDLKELTK